MKCADNPVQYHFPKPCLCKAKFPGFIVAITDFHLSRAVAQTYAMADPGFRTLVAENSLNDSFHL